MSKYATTVKIKNAETKGIGLKQNYNVQEFNNIVISSTPDIIIRLDGMQTANKGSLAFPKKMVSLNQD